MKTTWMMGTALALLWTGGASAQQAVSGPGAGIPNGTPAQADASAIGNAGSPDPANDIVVTGTHIARPELQSAMPVAVLKADEARSFGYTTAYDALQLNPAVAPGLGIANTQGEAFDTGVANINLRNLGVNRTLVLVDGKRWVSGGARTSAVDLNTIPDAMIDRFEIVTGGAAAIYGADAVTGAVNVIMKKEIEGLHLSAINGISQQGDARQTYFSASTGLKFGDGRGSFVVGGNYNYFAPLRDTDRYTNRVGYVTNPLSKGPNDGIPDNVLDDNIRYIQRASFPTFYYNNQFYALRGGAVNPVGYDYVITPGSLGNGHGGPGATNFENHYLRDKQVLGSLYSHLGYELTPTISWGLTFDYAHTYTRGPTVFPEVRDDARPVNWWGGTTGEVATLTNPFLPTALRQFMVANGLTSIPLNRTYSNLPQPFEQHKRDSFTVGTDVGGALTGDLKWSAFFRYGQTVDHVETTNMVRHFEWLYARNAIADPATGQPVCADAAARAAGCVPFNFFTTDGPSQAFLNYVLANRYEWRKNALYTGGGNVTGKVFSLPYGDVSIALGAEWRRETLSTRDDPDTAKLSDIIFAPGSDYVRHPALDEARKTTEAYGELVVPLLKDLPLAHRLEVEGAYRYSHYSDTPDTHTWKAGGTWEPVAGLVLRGVYSHSVRVPNFGELYSPQIVQTVGITADPCSGVYITQGPDRAKNCAALLPSVALPLPYPNTNAPVIYLGGNPALTPEKSNSYTLGAVFQPHFLRGLDLTVDYWNIDISNVITALPYASILNLCVDSASGINNIYCSLINRNAAGQIATISANTYNLAALGARGIDFGANYRRQVGPGSLQLGFNGTYLLRQTVLGTQGVTGVNYAGQWNYPRFKATLMTDYAVGKFSLGLNTRFISRSVYDATDASPETRSPNHIPAYVYNDLTLQFRPTSRYALTFGVRNISNVGVFGPLQDTGPGPNSSGGAQTGAAYYDAIGRYLFAKVDVSF